MRRRREREWREPARTGPSPQSALEDAARLGGSSLKGTCHGPESKAMFASGGAAFVGKLVPMKTQQTTRFASTHAAFAVVRGSVLGRQAPMLGRNTVAR